MMVPWSEKQLISSQSLVDQPRFCWIFSFSRNWTWTALLLGDRILILFGSYRASYPSYPFSNYRISPISTKEYRWRGFGVNKPWQYKRKGNLTTRGYSKTWSKTMMNLAQFRNLLARWNVWAPDLTLGAIRNLLSKYKNTKYQRGNRIIIIASVANLATRWRH